MTTTSPQTAMLMALSMLKGVGPAALRKVAKIPQFPDISIDVIAENVPSIAKSFDASPHTWREALEAASEQLDLLDRHYSRVLSPLDPDYPRLLADTKDDPFLIYVKGTLAQSPEQSIAIIGTREPTSHGQRTAVKIAQYCVGQEWSVVSGLAIGCDGIAHQATLNAGGHTVAVLAHGLQMVAPSRHQKLAEAILDAGGALVSQFRFGTKVQSQQYVQRDRVQAGLARGVVMIQSDVTGGSLHAARAALEYKRWLAVPYPTNVDRERNEPKVQANLVIAEADKGAAALLLRCTPTDMDRVLVLRSREDYSCLSNVMVENSISRLESIAI